MGGKVKKILKSGNAERGLRPRADPDGVARKTSTGQDGRWRGAPGDRPSEIRYAPSGLNSESMGQALHGPRMVEKNKKSHKSCLQFWVLNGCVIVEILS